MFKSTLFLITKTCTADMKMLIESITTTYITRKSSFNIISFKELILCLNWNIEIIDYFIGFKVWSSCITVPRTIQGSTDMLGCWRRYIPPWMCLVEDVVDWSNTSCPTRNDSRKLNGFIKSYKWSIVSKYQEMLGTSYGSAGLYRYCREIVLYNA